jgi:hypothetical protein
MTVDLIVPSFVSEMPDRFGCSPSALAFLHKTIFGGAGEGLAVLIDSFGSASVFHTFGHEARQRGAGERLAILPDRLALTAVVGQRHSRRRTQSEDRD